MITLYSGTPGSGKSLDCARTIYNWCRRGAPIICNFPINVDNIRMRKEKEIYFVPNSELNPDDLVAFSREYFSGRPLREDAILLMLDESQLLFNARDWRSKGRDRWNWFFTMHRHFGFYIILCCQYDAMLDCQVHCLIEYEIIHRKVKNIGWRGYLLSFLMLAPFNLFVKVRVWYPMKEKVNAEFFKSRKRYFKIYDTFELLDAPSQERPKDVPDRSGVLKPYRLGKKYRELPFGDDEKEENPNGCDLPLPDDEIQEKE